MSELLRPSLGVDIRLNAAAAGGLWRIHAGRDQIENTIVNPAVNTRDAMPGGGGLTIQTQEAGSGQMGGTASFRDFGRAICPDYCFGHGNCMSAGVAAKAFDPIVMARQVGEGTGLGLSQVYGLVRLSGG
jgi:signal transduction histidine kinase